jgi:Raf kinase inhibitor-like YbhB/YbcL family protein
MLEKLPDVIGHVLQGARAGLDKILFNRIDLRNGTAQIQISSLAFSDHAPIPPRFTADGEGLSPPLQWRGVPETAASLVLIVEDADSPTSEPLVHVIAVDIDPKTNALEEGALMAPEDDSDTPLDTRLSLGRNSLLGHAWTPPDPPPGHGVHRYAFQMFALAAGEPFSKTPGRDEVEDAVRERAFASGCLIGTYARDNSVKLDRRERALVEEDEVPAPPVLDPATN